MEKIQKLREQIEAAQMELAKAEAEVKQVIPSQVAAPKWIVRTELRPHQIEGVTFMKQRELSPASGGINADDMGLGKSLQVIALARDTDKDVVLGTNGVTLIVCPKNLVYNWANEFEKHTNLKIDRDVLVYHGADRPDLAHLNVRTGTQRVKFVITTPTIVVDECPDFRLVGSAEQNWKPGQPVKRRRKEKPVPKRSIFHAGSWKRIVVDEGHIMRNPKSHALRAVCSLDAKYRWLLSGTIFNNGISDLSSMCEFLRLKSRSEPFCEAYNDSKWWCKATVDQIAIFQKEYMIRRDKSLLNLPPKVVESFECKMSPEEMQLHRKLVEESQAEFSDIMNGELSHLHQYAHLLLLLLRIRQSCSDRRLIIPANTCVLCPKHEPNVIQPGDQYELLGCDRHVVCMQCKFPADRHCYICHDPAVSSTRTDALMEQLQEMRRKDRTNAALVFSQWTSYLTLVETQLKKHNIPFLRLDGTGSSRQRQATVNQFQDERGPPVLLCSYAMGLGVTLTRANHVFLMDKWWNPQVENQSMDRAYRFGQTRPVKVVRFISDSPVEKMIEQMQHTKMDNSKFFVTGELKDRPPVKSGISFEDLKKFFRKMYHVVGKDAAAPMDVDDEVPDVPRRKPKRIHVELSDNESVSESSGAPKAKKVRKPSKAIASLKDAHISAMDML